MKSRAYVRISCVGAAFNRMPKSGPSADGATGRFAAIEKIASLLHKGPMSVRSGNKWIRFRFSAEKAKAAIMFMLERPGKHDLHELLKACYFADKKHLNDWRRPIFGATYRAMKFGPVPLEIYEMLKGESLWLAELGIDAMPWMLNGYRVQKNGNETADTDVLSSSDIEALKWGHNISSHMSFDFRTSVTHGPDWQAANLGTMRYEDMIEEGPEKADFVEYLTETGPHMKL